jgi:hypothetical protein
MSDQQNTDQHVDVCEKCLGVILAEPRDCDIDPHSVPRRVSAGSNASSSVENSKGSGGDASSDSENNDNKHEDEHEESGHDGETKNEESDHDEGGDDDETDGATSGSDSEYDRHSLWVEHHPTIDALERSAKTCRLCAVLLASYLSFATHTRDVIPYHVGSAPDPRLLQFNTSRIGLLNTTTTDWVELLRHGILEKLMITGDPDRHPSGGPFLLIKRDDINLQCTNYSPTKNVGFRS